MHMLKAYASYAETLESYAQDVDAPDVHAPAAPLIGMISRSGPSLVPCRFVRRLLFLLILLCLVSPCSESSQPARRKCQMWRPQSCGKSGAPVPPWCPVGFLLAEDEEDFEMVIGGGCFLRYRWQHAPFQPPQMWMPKTLKTWMRQTWTQQVERKIL